jgi:HD-GYP domain-containing protein (c-di-GMP phosphodiesterase class II)
MSTRRYLALLVAIQAASMACGLAFHYVYVDSAMRHEAEQQLWTALTENARQIAGRIDRSSVEGPGARGVLDTAKHEFGCDALLLGDDGQPLVTDDADTPAPKIDWTRVSAEWGTFDGPIRGRIDETGNRQVAIAWPLANRQGYVLVKTGISTARLSLAGFLPVLQLADGLAVVWTSALAGVACFLLVTYVKRSPATATAPDAEKLKHSQDLVRTQETVIFGLAKLSDSRDPDTGDHLERISYYSSTLAAALLNRPEFRDQVTPSFVRLIGISSALHDIGKVGVEDAILKKPGPLSPQERAAMTLHTRIGEKCLREIEQRLGTSNFLQMAREIAASHHERWDGTGYPEGLSGEQIPLAARIVAVADVYDALSSKRVYKEALPHEECLSIIAAEAGMHFDPRIVEVLLEIEDRFRSISSHLRTSREPEPTHALA